jgi:hypothetical protein
MLPKDELLFWTSEWRQLEEQSMKELSERREAKEFPSFREFARWLLSTDED